MAIPSSVITLAGQEVPVHRLNTVVLGAGAAGMSCVLHLVDQLQQSGVKDAVDRVACVTTGLSLGASRMSGSDKQTYYKMGTSPRIPDTAQDFAETLTAFGCMHGDHALIEGLASLRGFFRLVDSGVPFPHDPDGAFIGYKTDHDPYERATSAGPKTSKFMSECLEARVRAAKVTFFDKQELVELLRDGSGRIIGLVTIKKSQAAKPGMGLTVFLAENLVLAAGGPGQVYRVTVYPLGQVGIHGLALRAGLTANNLTESQYGLASISFRWNVSGTYMQVVPRIFSTAADGVSAEREFLTEYFPDMPAMATNIFLKGYQWPFDAQRIDGGRSSLVDMAVHREIFDRKRRVFMDFLRNPIGAEDMQPFAIAAMDEEARGYLERTGALQDRPIDRLIHMNQPAIDIYTEHGIDLTAEPLEIAVCAQHMNGGFAVNAWWESTIPHTFVIGEMAGTHGVKRPGGSALNSGQAGALRAAQYITQVYGAAVADPGLLDGASRQAATAAIERVRSYPKSTGPTPKAVMREIGERMSRAGAHIRDSADIAAALQDALAQYRRLQATGIRAATPRDLAPAIQADHQCLTQVALLFAIKDLIAKGLGSRGSYVVLDPAGKPMPEILADRRGQVPCWRPENEDLRQTIQEVAYDPAAPEFFRAEQVAIRPIPTRDVAFETAWTAYREKRIFRDA